MSDERNEWEAWPQWDGVEQLHINDDLRIGFILIDHPAYLTYREKQPPTFRDWLDSPVITKRTNYVIWVKVRQR